MQYITIILGFAATVFAILGDTYNARTRRLTRIGVLTIIATFAIAIASMWQTLQQSLDEKYKADQREKLRQVASVELHEAVDSLVRVFYGMTVQDEDTVFIGMKNYDSVFDRISTLTFVEHLTEIRVESPTPDWWWGTPIETKTVREYIAYGVTKSLRSIDMTIAKYNLYIDPHVIISASALQHHPVVERLIFLDESQKDGPLLSGLLEHQKAYRDFIFKCRLLSMEINRNITPDFIRQQTPEMFDITHVSTNVNVRGRD